MNIDLLEDVRDCKDWQTRLYVIGDVHGCFTALQNILKQIAKDLIKNPLAPPQTATIVFVGDYIDRGPDNYKVIELMTELTCVPERVLQELEPEFPNRFRPGAPRVDVRTLAGNHEVMFDQAILSCWNSEDLDTVRFSDHSPRGLWLMNGGSKVIDQYEKALKTDTFLMPPHHIAFFRKLDTHWTLTSCGPDKDQTWVIVHAGIHPTAKLNQQIQETVQWIREVYYNHDFTVADKIQDGKTRIIGGHTPVKEVVNKGGKLMIDTGCVFGNKLSCVILNTDEPFENPRILQAEEPGLEKKF